MVGKDNLTSISIMGGVEYQTGDKNEVEDVGNNESDQDRNTSTSSEETEGEVIDEVSMSDASWVEDMKTSTLTREPRGKKRFNNGLDFSSSLSPVRIIPSNRKQFRQDTRS